jgi:hypothetical protein
MRSQALEELAANSPFRQGRHVNIARQLAPANLNDCQLVWIRVRQSPEDERIRDRESSAQQANDETTGCHSQG